MGWAAYLLHSDTYGKMDGKIPTFLTGFPMAEISLPNKIMLELPIPKWQPAYQMKRRLIFYVRQSNPIYENTEVQV